MIAIAKYVGVFFLTASATFAVLALGSTVNRSAAPDIPQQQEQVSILV